MNVKGLCINKRLASAICERVNDIPLSDLQGGLRVFNDYQWDGFSMIEFKSLLALFSGLVEKGFFASVADEHLFVFNYSTDVTEMDIASVLQLGEARVFLDIESKDDPSDPKLTNKLERQLRKRRKEHMPQLLKEKPYLIVGFANRVFYKAFFFDGENETEITDEDELKHRISVAKGDGAVEDVLYQSSSIASIVKVCNEIRRGKYSYFEETARLSDQLADALSNYGCAIVYGNAGTGKSVLALKLFFENPSAKMLVLNSKLYFAMGMSKEYAQGRATFNSGAFIDSIDTETISIIDECQRLPLDELIEIVRRSKFSFLFGDSKQAFTKKGYLGGADKLAGILKEEIGVESFVKRIRKSRRYSDAVADALDTLTSLKDETSKPNSDVKLPNDYSIKVLFSEAQFLSEYEKAEGVKKIYAPIADSRSDVLKIGDKEFVKADYTDDDFSVWPSDGNLFGITYHALSFDVDHCFVFLDKLRMISHGKKRTFYTSARNEPSDFSDIQIYLNELNVLFTRGRKSLTIFVKDIEAYLHLQALVSKLE